MAVRQRRGDRSDVRVYAAARAALRRRVCARGRPDLRPFAREAHVIRAPEREAAPLAEVSRPVTGQRRRALAQVIAPLIVFALVIGVSLFISYLLLEPRRRVLVPP